MKNVRSLFLLSTLLLLQNVNPFSSPNPQPQQQQQNNLSRKAFISTTTAATFLALPQIAKAASVAGATASEGGPGVGAKAPEFTLPNAKEEGVDVALSGLLKTGKWTVLYFYPGAFTSGCTLEARGFQRDIEKYRTLNSQIVGVSVDPIEKNAQFCKSEGLDFVLLSDTLGVVSKKYGSALAVPGFGSFSNRQTYIIDPKGSVRWVFTDVESRVPRHSAEVLEKLEELESA